MKKNKSKSRNQSAAKKVRKELASQLTTAFGQVIAAFGKAKKADKVIEKFAKQLAKKVTITAVSDDSIAPFIKEEKAPATAPKEKTVKPIAAKKVKAPVKEEPELK